MRRGLRPVRSSIRRSRYCAVFGCTCSRSAVGETLVQALTTMTAPTRTALMDAAHSLDLSPELMLPGITIRTGGTADPYPIEAMQIAKFTGENFVLQGQVIQAGAS